MCHDSIGSDTDAEGSDRRNYVKPKRKKSDRDNRGKLFWNPEGAKPNEGSMSSHTRNRQLPSWLNLECKENHYLNDCSNISEGQKKNMLSEWRENNGRKCVRRRSKGSLPKETAWIFYVYVPKLRTITLLYLVLLFARALSNQSLWLMWDQIQILFQLSYSRPC